MQIDFLGIHHLLGTDCDLTDITILELPFDDHPSIIPRELILKHVRTFPSLLRNDLFSLIVYVVDRRLQWQSSLEIERSEHRGWPHRLLVYQELLSVPEIELGLSDMACPNINHIIVIDRLVLWLSPISITNQHILVRTNFPHSLQSTLNLVHTIWLPNLIRIGIFLDFPLRILLQIENKKLPIFIMPSLVPTKLRVIVCLSDQILISPMFLGVEGDYRFCIIFEWVAEIAKFETVVVIPSVLTDAEQFRICEGVDKGLICFFVQELEWNSHELVFFQVQDSDAVLSGFQHNSLPLIHHPKSIHNLLKNVFKKDFPICIKMHYTVLAMASHPQETVAVVQGIVKIQYLLVCLLQFYLLFVHQEHCGSEVIASKSNNTKRISLAIYRRIKCYYLSQIYFEGSSDYLYLL